MAAVVGLLLYVELQWRNVILHISLLELWNSVECVIYRCRLFPVESELVVLGLEVVHSQIGLLGLRQEYLELSQLSLLLRFAEYDLQQVTQGVLQRRVALFDQIVLDETPHVHNLMWESFCVKLERLQSCGKQK